MHAEHIPEQKNVEADAGSRRALDQSNCMDVESGDLSSSGDEMESISCQPICNKAQHTAEETFQFQAQPRSSSRCSSPAMDEHQTICTSPIHSPRKMLAEGLAGGSLGDSDNCTGFAGTTLVSSLN